jgi:hypothetical protein
LRSASRGDDSPVTPNVPKSFEWRFDIVAIVEEQASAVATFALSLAGPCKTSALAGAVGVCMPCRAVRLEYHEPMNRAILHAIEHSSQHGPDNSPSGKHGIACLVVCCTSCNLQEISACRSLTELQKLGAEVQHVRLAVLICSQTRVPAGCWLRSRLLQVGNKLVCVARSVLVSAKSAR